MDDDFIIQSDNQSTNVKSVRISRRELIVISWGIIVGVISLLLYLGFSAWNKYYEGQSAALKILGKENAELAYTYYFPRSYPEMFGGYVTDDMVRSARYADDSLGEVLTKLGYECVHGSDYLRYTNPVEYFMQKEIGIIEGKWLIYSIGIVVVLLGIMTVSYATDKREIHLLKDKIVLKTKSGKQEQFSTDSISSVGVTKNKTITLKGNNIRYKITRVKNADEIKNAILQKISLLKGSSTPVVFPERNSADELEKYKNLLDKGVITQDEFDAKKKQLLGL